MPRPSTPLVGRDAPLAALTGVLDAAVAGTAGAVVLSGDAGVGKTRLVAEVLAAAAARGMRTVVGHCVDFGQTALPFLPFSEIVGRLAEGEPQLVDEVLAAHPAALRLLPARRRDTATEDRLDPSALFAAVAAAFDHLADQAPLLVVVEDVHWADQSSRDLLGFLFARLGTQRLTVLATYRSDDLHRRHPLRQVVAEWARLPVVSRLDLGPLPAPAVARLVRALRPELGPDAVRAIVERADGNAFFAEELVAAGTSAADALPPELAGLLLVRVDRLSAPARDAVRILAVAGRPVTHDLLAAVAATDGAALDDALREAVDAHLLETRGDSAYGFRHALVGEAVEDDLLPGERIRLHAAFVTALQDRPALGTDAELARHARAAHDLAVAFRAGVRAADEALGVGAPAEAARHLELALELVAALPPEAVTRPRWQLVVDAAEAWTGAGFPERARALVAAELAAPETGAEDGTDDEAGHRVARAHLLHQAALIDYWLDERNDARTHVDQALELLAGRPPGALEVALLGLRARVLDSLAGWREAVRVAEQAVATARSVDGADAASAARAAADAQATLVLLHRRTHDPGLAARDLAALADRAEQAGMSTVELRARHNQGTVLYESGDLAAAVAAYDRAVEVADRTGLRWSPYGISALTMRGLVLYDLGRWDDALASVTAPDAPPAARPGFQAVVALVEGARGHLEPPTTDLARVIWRQDPQVAVMGAAAEAEAWARAGDLDAARDHLDVAVATIAERWREPDFLARVRLAALAAGMVADAVDARPSAERPGWVAWVAGHVAAARHAAEVAVPDGPEIGPEGRAWRRRLEAEWARLRLAVPETGRPGRGSDAVGDPDAGGDVAASGAGPGAEHSPWLAAGSSAAVRALLAECPPSAEEHRRLWADTVTAFGFGMRYEQARARVGLAEAERAAGDIPAATATAAQAREVARELGARPLLDRLARLAVPARRRPDPDAGVPTGREREVLELIATGHTNRQIARTLFISEKTVSVHVSHLLAKLGAASRTEAVTVARRRRLLD